MKEKHLESQPTLETKKQANPQECNFIPELNRVDFFSRLKDSSPPPKTDLFTQMNINRTIWM